MSQPPLDGRDFRRLIDGQLSERDWQRQVENWLTLNGWWWIHIPSNVVVCPRCKQKIYRGVAKGFPDILAIKPPYMLWLELKVETGQLKPEQRRVKALLEACGMVFLKARPRDRQQLFDRIVHPEQVSAC